MKNFLLIIFLIFSAKSFGQNWNLIPNSDTSYYRITSSSMHENKIYAIFVKDSYASGLDSVLKFYPTTRFSHYIQGTPQITCMDTLGASWHGKHILKKANGDQILYNELDSAILFKLDNPIGVSWVMTKDSFAKEYIAKIVQTDTMTIDGVLDSIKMISIEVYLNGIFQNVNYNIRLSKNNGLIDNFHWYSFPYTAELMYMTRIEKAFTHHSIGYANLFSLYTPGNEFQYTRNYHTNVYHDYKYHDSIISYQSAGPDSGVVTLKRSFRAHVRSNIPTPFDTTFGACNLIISDTVYSGHPIQYPKGQSLIRDFRKATLVELTPSPFPINEAIEIDKHYYYTTACTNLVQTTFKGTHSVGPYHQLTSNCVESNVPAPTCYYYFKSVFLENYGRIHHSETESCVATGGSYSKNDSTTYFKTPTCTFGYKESFCPLGTIDFEKSNQITLYPNPAANSITLRDNNPNGATYEVGIVNLMGTRVKNITLSNHDSINIADLAPGYYIALCKKNGVYFRMAFTKM